MMHIKRIPAGSERSPIGLRYTLVALVVAGALCAFSLVAPGAFG